MTSTILNWKCQSKKELSVFISEQTNSCSILSLQIQIQILKFKFKFSSLLNQLSPISNKMKKTFFCARLFILNKTAQWSHAWGRMGWDVTNGKSQVMLWCMRQERSWSHLFWNVTQLEWGSGPTSSQIATGLLRWNSILRFENDWKHFGWPNWRPGSKREKKPDGSCNSFAWVFLHELSCTNGL